ncbi:MAG TPA: OmpA family protein, partial [Polyangia bacterium]|nr:OmpA family protein [Polyangia bacterium]
VLALTLLSPSLAQAQPADDPGLSEPAPPPPKPAPPPPRATPTVPHSDASATMMAPHDESAPPQMRETVDTQVTWLDSAGPATGDDDLYARVAASTVTGPIGLFRTMSGDVGRSNNFRVGINLQLFTQDNFLIAGANGLTGDTNQRFLGNLTIDYTPWKYLELYLGIYNSSNQNTRSEGPPQRTDPEVILALGDVGAGIKGRVPVTKWFDLALHLGLRFFNSVSGVSVLGSATNFAPDLIASFDLRHATATANVPLRFHINFGYVVDNSIDLLPAGQCASSTTDDACIRSRVVETFAYGINPSRFKLAAAVDAPLAFANNKVGLDLIFEYHVDIAVGDGDTLVGNAVRNSFVVADQPDRVDGISQQYLTFGARVRPVAGLILDAGLDVGLSSYGFRYGSPLPVWNLILGAAYAYDPGAGRGRTKVVTKTITREAERPEGKLRGFVRDAATKKPIGGATIKYTTRRATSQLSDADGSFVSYGFQPGPLTLEVSRDDYEPATVDTSVQANGETPLEILLTAKPPAASDVRIKVADDAGMPVGTATVRLTNTATAAVVDAQPEGMAGFDAKLLAGDWLMEVNAPGYLSKSRIITMTAGQPQNVEVVLRKKPTTSHVTLGRNEIVIKGTIHFGTDNAELRPDGEQILDEVADVLAKHPEIRRIRVEGHTDNRGNAEHNLQLSKARAAAVVQYLVKVGVDPSRVESEGYGASQPLVPNMTPAQRAKNRRVAFKILEQGPRQ